MSDFSGNVYAITANSNVYFCADCGAETRTNKLGGAIICSGCSQPKLVKGWPGSLSLAIIRLRAS
jgi:DNA-directed RNA polymerase subunit RPC12/RpoP